MGEDLKKSFFGGSKMFEMVVAWVLSQESLT
jgi:hypothetical protein